MFPFELWVLGWQIFLGDKNSQDISIPSIYEVLENIEPINFILLHHALNYDNAQKS